MSEDIQQPEPEDSETVVVDELSMLKQRADLLGISYSNNIGVEKLKERIAAVQEGPEKAEEKEAVKVSSDALTRADLIKQATRLVRIRYSNMNPLKKDLPGEYFTVANGIIGTIKKFVPYGPASEAGWHVPEVIYKMMKRRTFTVVKTLRDDNGNPYQTPVERREFAIEVLDPLSKEELEVLAKDQRAAGRI